VRKSEKLSKKSRFLFYFYVPKRHKEKVKNACFAAGAGNLGNYSHCSFEYEGSGQFFSQSMSDPFIGKKMQLTQVREVKIEMIVPSQNVKKVLKNFLKNHPYEEPAYGFIEIQTTF
jgi:hypothetical protein